MQFVASESLPLVPNPADDGGATNTVPVPVGGGAVVVTVNEALLAAQPPGVVTAIGPVVPALGTVVVICVSLLTV